MGSIDWTSWLWWIGSVALALSGLVLLIRAMLWDWLRTRRTRPRRCPKCWYNLSGTESLTCSECGHTAKHERKLHRTRRRWRWVFIAPIMLLAAAFMAVQPTVYRDGWAGVIPTAALLWVATPLDESPIGEEPMQWVHDQLSTRLFGTLAKPQPDYNLSWIELRLIIDRGLAYRTHVSDDAYSTWHWNSTRNLFDQLLQHAFDAEQKGTISLARFQQRLFEELDLQFAINNRIMSPNHWVRTRWKLDIVSSWPGARFVAVEGYAVPDVSPDHPLAHELQRFHMTSLAGSAVFTTTDAPPSGRHDVTFRVNATTKRTSATGSESTGAALIDNHIVHSVLDFEGLQPVCSDEVDALLRSGMRELELIRTDRRVYGLTVRFEEPCIALLARMRLAVRVRLLLNGEQVATGRVILGTWETMDESEERLLIGGAFFREVVPNLVEVIESVDEGWSIVVEGDEILSNQNLRGSRYWAGRIEWPLQWSECERLVAFPRRNADHPSQ